MKSFLSKAYQNAPPSFLGTILAAAADPEITSFAGGFPNPISFPQEAFKASCERIIDRRGAEVFQYHRTEGVAGLRRRLALEYGARCGCTLDEENVLITSGSQQAIDSLARLCLDEGDGILLERPSYLGALQAFQQYQPSYYEVDLREDGLDLCCLERTLTENEGKIKLVYLIPEFQNPTGISYSAENRTRVTELLSRHEVILIEDDPYGQLRFEGERPPHIGLGKLPHSVLLGSFSKVATPGMRIGYAISEDKELLRHLTAALEASTLHANVFAQYLLLDYLEHNDQETHLRKIRARYRSQCRAMCDAMEKHFPSSVTFTRPQGGMFLWATLPEGVSARKIFPKARDRKVLFVPGDPFYVSRQDANTMRLNFTNASEAEIECGIRRLGALLREECGE